VYGTGYIVYGPGFRVWFRVWFMFKDVRARIRGIHDLRLRGYTTGFRVYA